MKLWMLLILLVSLGAKTGFVDEDIKAGELSRAVARRAEVVTIRDFLQEGANPNHSLQGPEFARCGDDVKGPALCNAVAGLGVDIKVVKLLLDYGADSSVKNSKQKSAFDLSFIWSNSEAMRLLISHGHPLNEEELKGLEPQMIGTREGKNFQELLQFVKSQKKSLSSLNFEFLA